MNQPSPAIVAQSAVRRLPRTALLLLCAVYVLSGFIGRDAWRQADVTALGVMAELAQGTAAWFRPTLLGMPPENFALLPYWLGAWALQWRPDWMAADFAARIPFMALLACTMAATWYGSYYLGRSPRAQPVAFAFGGEAHPKDYARAIADGSLLALMACLGLAQLSHETTPALAQVAGAAVLLAGLATLPYHRRLALTGALLGMLLLALSGAPALALLFGLGGVIVHWLDRHPEASGAPGKSAPWSDALTLLLGVLLTGVVSIQLGLLRWKVQWPEATWIEWKGYGELFLWFTWPAWPMAAWSVWRWRRQVFNRHLSRHLALPLWFALATSGATLLVSAPDRTLLLALPAMATLAAFSLPTLRRQMAAIIDWFTLLFFSGCGVIIWVVWIAMQTGVPSQPAANVERLAPGFEPSFSFWELVLALLATLAWAALVHWRVGRHRAALWKSLALPAGGAALCWMLLMTLWMPLLNYAQSYTTLVRNTVAQIQPQGCVETLALGQGKLAAFQFYGGLQLQPADGLTRCPWLLAEPGADLAIPGRVDLQQWSLMVDLRHPTDTNETILLFRRR